MNRRRTALLGLLTLAAIPAITSACAPRPEEKNSATPCCGATGQVEEAPSAFAVGGATFDGIQIKPVVYDTGACPSFSDPDPLGSFLDMERAGPTTDVNATTGVFQLQLTENAIGRKVAFVACADDCDDVVGIGLLGAPVAPTDVGEFLVVAPIQLVSPTGSLGPSTLELLADCELESRDIRGSLLTADVRHVLSASVGYPAAPTAAEVDDLMSRLTIFGGGIDALLSVSSGDAAVFAGLRVGAEAGVDACLGGESLLGCQGATEIDSEFFRYYQLARAPIPPVPTPAPVGTAAPGPLPPEDQLSPFLMSIWTESIAADLGPMPPLATDSLGKSLLLQNAMFRYELMEKAIFDAVASTQFQDLQTGTDKPLSLTFSSAGLPSIADSLATIRSAIETGDMSNPNGVYAAWGLSARDIGRNMDVQLGGTPQATFQTLMQGAFDIGGQMQSAIDGTETPQEMYAEIYSAGDGANGAYQKVFTMVGGAIAGHPLVQQIALTDIVYFAAVQSFPPVSAGVQ